MQRKTKLVPVVPLPQFWRLLGVSAAHGKVLRNTDPDFPRDKLLEIGVNRLGIREDDGAVYQRKLQIRAQQPRVIPVNLSDPKAAAAKSVAKRRANAAKRRAQIAEVTR